MKRKRIKVTATNTLDALALECETRRSVYLTMLDSIQKMQKAHHERKEE